MEILKDLKTYVINLDRRPDRLIDLKLPITWERFSATDGQKFTNHPNNEQGWRGCYDSHLRLVNGLNKEDFKYYLIFEDDVDVCDDFVNKLDVLISKLPDDWELLFLGGWNVGDKINYVDGIDIAKKVYCTHAFLFKSEIIDKLSKKFNSRIYKIDILLSELLPELNAYICNPTIAWQRPGFSDVVNKVTHNNHLK